ncbi:MAG: Ig-like domain-containing protein [Bacteroidetes bacterium]|nr:Ig-like domain-containing protein [Bacteroidota bacterium]
MKAPIYYIIVICLLLIGFSCAIPMAPTGGPKDTQAPKLLKTTPENGSVNFTSPKIEFRFNEYIELNNPAKNIFITPPVDVFPETKSKGKTVVVDFKNTHLLPKTTYSIRFNGAVKDANEGNELKEMQYVFSTGEFIDSLTITGTITNALDGLPLKSIKVCAYNPDSFTDSFVYKKKPLTYAYTNADGYYAMENLRPETFKIVAFKDNNEDNLLTPNEDLGFIDYPVKSVLKSSKERADMVLAKQEGRGDKLISSVVFNPPRIMALHLALYYDVTVNINEEKEDFTYFKQYNVRPDSTIYWIDDMDTLEKRVSFYNCFLKKDTTLIPQKVSLKAFNVAISTDISIDQFNKPTQYNSILRFNNPIKSIDTSKIYITKDKTKRTKLRGFEFIDNASTLLGLKWDYDLEETYTITLDSGAATNIYNKQNDSTTVLNNAPNKADYGSLSLVFDSLSRGVGYIFQLVNKENGVVSHETYVSIDKRDSTSWGVSIPYLKPGKYYLRAIIDKLPNRVFDGANLTLHQHPETVYIRPEEILIKANWEVTDVHFKIGGKR